MSKVIRPAGAVIAVAAVAVLAGGCSSDSGGKDTPGNGQTPTAVDDGNGGQNSDGVQVGGTWYQGTDRLTISGNKADAVLGKDSCSGSVTVVPPTATLRLTCQDGSTEWSSGTIGQVYPCMFTVTWANGEEEGFLKADPSSPPKDASDPSGLTTPASCAGK
jgi:hypothetical protein